MIEYFETQSEKDVRMEDIQAAECSCATVVA